MSTLNRNEQVLMVQKHYGMGFFSTWIMVITTVQWIMLDMYLPALPILKEEFGVSEALLNLSLTAGMITAAIGTLVSGILSDRYGRKRLLLAGHAVNIISVLCCAGVNSVFLLTIMRGLTGLGSGFVLSITLAIIKDSFEGERFNRTMTILQSVAVVGPVFAPMLGSLIINTFSWRFIFIFLGLASLITMLPMLVMTETWPPEKRVMDSSEQMLRGALELITDRGFVLFVGIMAMVTIPVWAYVGVSSYVYINEFGRSNLVYGVYYGIGAVINCLAPFAYITIARHLGLRRTVTISVAVLIAGAGILLTAGTLSPVLFLLGVAPVLITEGMVRPLGMVVLLEEYPTASGSVSSWTQFIMNAVGIVGTSLATLGWNSMVIGIGSITLVCAVICVLCWVTILKKRYLTNGLSR